MNTPAAAPVEKLGLTGHTAMVHKKEAEGTITIDAYTGQVIQSHEPGAELPEWAEGLAMAQLAERLQFYTNRLGPQFTQDMQRPEVYAFEDLSWLGVHAESGDEFDQPADDEHRMEVVATILGIDRDSGDIEGTLAEVEIARDVYRTEGEMKDLTESQDGRFEDVSKTGTSGQ